MPFSWKQLYLRTLGRIVPSDLFSHRFPVSVKGVCLIDGRVVLLQNEHGYWDLPGGKLHRNEGIRQCLRRELQEELNIQAEPGALLGATRLQVRNTVNMVVLIYHCTTTARPGELKFSSEHFAIDTFAPSALSGLNLPEPYRNAIDEAFAINQ